MTQRREGEEGGEKISWDYKAVVSARCVPYLCTRVRSTQAPLVSFSASQDRPTPFLPGQERISSLVYCFFCDASAAGKRASVSDDPLRARPPKATDMMIWLLATTGPRTTGSSKSPLWDEITVGSVLATSDADRWVSKFHVVRSL